MGRPAERTTEFAFELAWGRPCLDFVNTVSGKRLRGPIERLNGYADLVAFGRQSGLLSEEQARRLTAEGQRRPGEAEAVLRRAVDLRETVYRILRAAADGETPAGDDLELFNAALGRALSHERLVRDGRRFHLGFPAADVSLDAMLWPVLRSAAELLASADLQRVRLCEATSTEGCGWLFLDETRSRTRRWCSMKECGNRAKARRHYRRHKGGR